MDDVRHQLQRYKKDNHNLEGELRGMCTWVDVRSPQDLSSCYIANTNAEQKARHLETKVTETAETIKQLREERALLATDHKDLQQRFSTLSEVS